MLLRLRRLALACAIALPATAAIALPARAADPSASEDAATDDAASDPKAPPRRDGVFTLGQLSVVGTRTTDAAVDDAVITARELWTFDTLTLDDAVKLTPGVTSTQDSNGRRNEHDIFVRGYGRLQVPLSIDGVRVYLPADNRLDFRRFLTTDLAEVQIQKGAASVIDGPGAVGGAINLVTRKPVAPFEARVSGGMEFDGDGREAAWNGSATVGTRQPLFYAQASASVLDRDHWRLPDGFRGTAIQPPGDRLRSASRDSRINLKFGLTPNARDEYSLSFTRQDGRKGAPLNVYNNPPNPPNSYWDWPDWNIRNLYLLTQTEWDGGTYLKTRAYRNRFDNVLSAYDDASYTSQSNPGRFNSYYADTSLGGSVELGLVPAAGHRLRLAAHWRSDRHTEFNVNRPTNPNPALRLREPVQRSREDTWSLAIEDRWQAGDALEAVVGASYDRNRVTLAQDYSSSRGLFAYPTGGSHAWNGQAALYWQRDADNRFGASLSSRTRFPTNFERFSTRFGTAIPNPDLGSERGTNLALSWQRQFGAAGRLQAAVFHSWLRDMIQTVVVDPGPPQLTQTRNVGDGRISGLELGGEGRLGDALQVGGNATFLHRRIRDPLQPQYRPVGTPERQLLLYATWRPAPDWQVTPSLEHAGARWSDGPAGSYLRTGRYTLANLQVQWQAAPAWQVALGARNLGDRQYELAWGFPEPGRSIYLKFDYAP